MMSDDEIQKVVEEWCPILLKADGMIDQRMVGQLCHEIERATRHRIVDSLNAVTHAIDTRVPLREVLRSAKVCS
jgi:hypothetical protein